MSAEEVIADVLRQHAKTGETREGNPWKDRCYCGGWTYSMAGHQASAVVDAIRAMTHAEQAELLGGGCEIETVPLFTTSVGSGEVLRRWSRSRVVGPWQEKP